MPRIVAITSLQTTMAWPAGLDTSPSKANWEKYRGEIYEVFFDESFFKFFGLSDPEGNFCYGAVGIPTSQFSLFNFQMNKLFDEYRHAVAGSSPKEFKSADLMRLDQPVQIQFVRSLAAILEEVGGFISGFYAPVAGLVLERIRVNLMGMAASVPRHHKRLFKAAQQELIVTLTGPNQADLIVRMLQAPASGMAHFLGWLDASFRIVYDPRQKQEDEIIRMEMANYLDMASRVSFGDENKNAQYLGMDITQKSENSFGLQAADLIAGIVRKFCRENKKLVEHGASLRLVTPSSIEDVMQLVSIQGEWLKYGAIVPTHPKLDAALGTPNAANPLSYMTHLLAAGVLGTLTSTGRYRAIEIHNGLVFDMND
jgi:hypothetical protein